MLWFLILIIMLMFCFGLWLGILTERSRCLNIIQDEPDFPGPIPENIKTIYNKVGLEAYSRACSRAAKNAIYTKIKSTRW